MTGQVHMIGELAALAAAMGWAGSVVLSKPMTARLSAGAIQATYLWVAALVSLVLALALGKLDDAFRGPPLATTFLVAGPMLGALGDFLLIKAIATAAVGRLMTVMTSLFVLFTALGSVFLLGESLAVKDWIGGVLILAGVFAANITATPRGVVTDRAKPNARLAWAKRSPLRRRLLEGAVGGARPIILPALVGILWAASLLMWDVGLDDVDPVAAVAIGNLTPGILCAGLAVFMRSVRPAAINKRHVAILAAAGVLYATAVISSIFAVDIAHAGLTSILVSSAPLFAIPLSVIFLKERFSVFAAIGMTLCLAGVVAVVV